jgi:hypothetical protein
VRQRIAPRASGASSGIGMAFRPEMGEEWTELGEQVDGFTRRVGSSVVASWEVAASELARVTIGRADEKVILERFSDGLVPALTPFQDLHKGAESAMRDGARDGAGQGTLAAATRPLVMLVIGLDDRAVRGWNKTVDYLQPVYDVAPDPEAAGRARAAMVAAGEPIASACRASEQVLREQLSRLPQAASLWDGVCDPFDAWQLALTRELEIALHRATRGMIAEIRGG